jgi:integrase
MLQRPKAIKPDKPYPEFPLFPHDRGKWAKKIKGKMIYFGSWDDPFGALAEYEALDGANEKPSSDKCLVLGDLLNLFLEQKSAQVQEGLIVKRTYQELENTAIHFAKHVGRDRNANALTPADFGGYRANLVNVKKYGPVTTSNEIVRVRSMMTWIHKTYYPGTSPQFGPSFDRANRKSLRKHKADAKSKLLAPATIHAILDESGVHFRAMILLGINCGFGPTDCARLPIKLAQEAIKTGWLVFPRTKTFVPREAALWPETIEALAASLDRRPTPKTDDAKKSCFVAPAGTTYDPNDDGKAFLIQGRWKAAKKASKIEDGSFYCLRHTFNTIAEQTGDQIAVKLVMGHADGTMSENYRHKSGARSIDDTRLIKVASAVRNWLGFKAASSRGCSPIGL